MKKLLAILALSLSNFAWADAIQAEFGKVNIQDGMAHQSGVGIGYRKDFTRTFSLDGAIFSLRTDDAMGRPSDAASTRVEVGATVRAPLGRGFVLYDRFALGDQFGSWTNMKTRWSGNTDFNYWSNEVGLARTFNKTVDVRVGYRWRDTTGSAMGFKTETTRLAVGYNMGDGYRLGVSYDDLKGDYQAKQWTVGVTRSF